MREAHPAPTLVLGGNIKMFAKYLVAAAAALTLSLGVAGSVSAQQLVTTGGEFPLDPGACYDNDGKGLVEPMEIAWMKVGEATFTYKDKVVKRNAESAMWHHSPGDFILKICNEGSGPAVIEYLQFKPAGE